MLVFFVLLGANHFYRNRRPYSSKPSLQSHLSLKKTLQSKIGAKINYITHPRATQILKISNWMQR
jgi:hypothetical protein